MAVRVVSAPPATNRPTSWKIVSTGSGSPSISACDQRERRPSPIGQPRSSGTFAMTISISWVVHSTSPKNADSSKLMASMRMRRSDHSLTWRQLVLGEAEQVAREPGRELAGDGVDDLDPARVTRGRGDGVDEAGDHRLEPGGLVPHGPGREAAVDQTPLLEVLGVVAGDHVRLGGRLVDPVGAQRREDLVVPLDVEHVGVAGDGPEAVLLVAVHGSLARAQVHASCWRVRQNSGSSRSMAGRRLAVSVDRSRRASCRTSPPIVQTSCSMPMRTAMPTTSVSAMFRVRHDTTAAMMPASSRGCQRSRSPPGPDEGGDHQRGQDRWRDLTQDAFGQRREVDQATGGGEEGHPQRVRAGAGQHDGGPHGTHVVLPVGIVPRAWPRRRAGRRCRAGRRSRWPGAPHPNSAGHRPQPRRRRPRPRATGASSRTGRAARGTRAGWRSRAGRRRAPGCRPARRRAVDDQPADAEGAPDAEVEGKAETPVVGAVPAHDRQRVGLVDQEVRRGHPPAQRFVGQRRSERGRVQQHPQVDGEGGDHRDGHATRRRRARR